MGHDDNTLPSTPLANKHCCHQRCGPRFKQLLVVQGGFYAAEFWEPGEHKRLHSCTVVPMQYHPKESQEDDYLNEETETLSEVEEGGHDEGMTTPAQKACCGSGAYSNVFRVRMDPAHHRLSKVSHVLLVHGLVENFKSQILAPVKSIRIVLEVSIPSLPTVRRHMSHPNTPRKVSLRGHTTCGAWDASFWSFSCGPSSIGARLRHLRATGTRDGFQELILNLIVPTMPSGK